MKLTCTYFNGEFRHERRNGVETFFVPDTDGLVAMMLDASGTDLLAYGQAAPSGFAHPSSAFRTGEHEDHSREWSAKLSACEQELREI